MLVWRWRLVFLKQFPLGTPYTYVVAYIQQLNRKFDIVKGYCDQGAMCESLIEEVRQFAPQIEGIVFTAKTKQDLLTLLQTRMEQRRTTLPLDRALLTQINEQQYRFSRSPVKPTEKPTEAGTITFYHPQGTHDDELWALALATCATKQKENEPHVLAAKWEVCNIVFGWSFRALLRLNLLSRIWFWVVVSWFWGRGSSRSNQRKTLLFLWACFLMSLVIPWILNNTSRRQLNSKFIICL